MKEKIIMWIAVLLALTVLLLNAFPAFACEPEGDGLANGAKDPRCRVTLPSTRTVQLARGVGGGSTAVTIAGNPTGNPNTNPVNAVTTADYSTNLTCFLPDGASTTNALGIIDKCPPPFLPPRAVKTPPPTPTLVAAKTNQPKGDSPSSARGMTSAWETIGPGESVWYRIDNEHNFYLDVWLDAYGRSGINFAVYSPDQSNNLSAATMPKGRGAPAKNDPSHDLWWRGAQAMGIWHVLVTNYNSAPVQYKIGYKQATEERNCRSYWEYLPTGAYVYWTACR